MIFSNICDLYSQAYSIEVSNRHFRLCSREREDEIGATRGIGLVSDAAADALDDLSADGEADAGALVLLMIVQTGEHIKDLIFMLVVYADTIV